MVQRITTCSSKATVDSSDENEDTELEAGLVDEAIDEDSGDLSSSNLSKTSSSSESEGGEDGLLANAIDKTPVGKAKAKGKQKQKAGSVRKGESECLLCIYALFSTMIAPENALPTGNKMDSEFAKKFTFNIAMFPFKECSKDLKKRTGKNTYMILNNNEPFDTWNAQLLVKSTKHSIRPGSTLLTMKSTSPLPVSHRRPSWFAPMKNTQICWNG